MLVVAVGFAVLAVTGCVVVRWAWRYQRPAGQDREGRRVVGPASPARVAVSCSDGVVVAWGWTRPGAASSELVAWKRMRLLGVLADGSTVILACRRQTSRLRRGSHRPALASLAPEDRTMVLVVGEEEGDALALLEQWREEGACLRVHIPSDPSTVELADEAGRAVLRARLAAV